MNNLKTRLIAAILFLGALFGATACGNDANVSNRVTGSAEKINMPDQFNTVADRCDNHGFRVYESSGSNAGLVVVRDAKCGEGVR